MIAYTICCASFSSVIERNAAVNKERNKVRIRHQKDKKDNMKNISKTELKAISHSCFHDEWWCITLSSFIAVLIGTTPFTFTEADEHSKKFRNRSVIVEKQKLSIDCGGIG